MAWGNKGRVFAMLSRYEDALDSFEEALRLRELLPDRGDRCGQLL